MIEKTAHIAGIGRKTSTKKPVSVKEKNMGSGFSINRFPAACCEEVH
jgi:hypothetical protein